MFMCRVFSCVVLRGCLLWPVSSLGKTVSLWPALFCTQRLNLPVTPGISWLIFTFQSPIMKRTSFFFECLTDTSVSVTWLILLSTGNVRNGIGKIWRMKSVLDAFLFMLPLKTTQLITLETNTNLITKWMTQKALPLLHLVELLWKQIITPGWGKLWKLLILSS